MAPHDTGEPSVGASGDEVHVGDELAHAHADVDPVAALVQEGVAGPVLRQRVLDAAQGKLRGGGLALLAADQLPQLARAVLAAQHQAGDDVVLVLQQVGSAGRGAQDLDLAVLVGELGREVVGVVGDRSPQAGGDGDDHEVLAAQVGGDVDDGAAVVGEGEGLLAAGVDPREALDVALAVGRKPHLFEQPYLRKPPGMPVTFSISLSTVIRHSVL